MSQISQKSISGITSITTPAGVDNQFSIHTNNTSEALKLDHAGNIHIHNHVNTTGISSASNFKTGSSNLHSTGLTVGDSFVHSTGINIGSNIKFGSTGIITATSFSGSGASLTNLNASNIASGTVPTARLGSGTASSSTFLAGDSTYKTVTGTTINNNADNRVITGSGTANTLEAESTLTYDGTNLDLGDNKYVRLGNSNKFQMWHNGGTGNTNIKQVTGDMYFYTGSDLNMLIRDGTSVDLYYANNKVVETHGDGLTFSRGSGNLIKYGTTSEFPNAAININRGGNGYANIRLSSNYGCGLFMAGASNNTDEFGINQDNQKNGYLDNRGGFIAFTTGSSGTTRMRIENSAEITFMGDALPSSDNNYDLGSSSKRWAQIYTTDLQLCNKGKTNIVDGTWGDWTLQEGENKIFMINNRTGKKYSLKMEEE